MNRIEPLSRASGGRADELVRRIEVMVLSLGSQTGVRLGSKEELRRSFQVAHGTINEAIRVLESRGTVELRRGAHGGVFAVAPSVYVRLGNALLGFLGDAASIENCLAVRAQIEPMALIEATKAAAAKPEALAELYTIIDDMTGALGNATESLRLNWQLHRKIAQMGNNGVLTGIYLALLDFIEQEVTEVASSRSVSLAQRILKVHREMVDAIASGDVGKAAEVAKKHPLPPEETDESLLAGERTAFHGRGA